MNLHDIREIAMQRSKRISMSEDHIYTIDDVDRYTSVSKWKLSHYEGFNSDKIIDNMMKSHKWKYSKYFGMTKEEIKKLWKDNGNNACRLGTLLHADIEDYYNNEEVDNDSVEYQYFMKFEEKRKENKLIPFEAELQIFDEDILISGTVDMIFYENTDSGPIFHVYDWKRSKHPIKFTADYDNMTTECIKHIPKTNYYEYCLQLNMYTYMLREKYGMNIATMNIVILHEDHEEYIHQNIEYLSEMDQLISNIKQEILN